MSQIVQGYAPVLMPHSPTFYGNINKNLFAKFDILDALVFTDLDVQDQTIDFVRNFTAAHSNAARIG